MKTAAKMAVLAAAALVALILGVGVGSVFISPDEVCAILAHFFFGTALPESIDPVYPSLVFNMRLPRVLMAFLTGAGLAVSGTVMQAVLRNPLASPFGLGVSAGAGLGAALVIVAGVSSGLLGAFLLPSVSLCFALVTVVLVVGWLAAPHVLDWATHTWYTVVRNRDLSASSGPAASSVAASSEAAAAPAASSEARPASSEPAAAPANAIIEGSWGVLDTAAARDEASLRAAAQELARQGAAYAVVTLKDSSGQILYPSALPAAAGSIEGASLDPSLIASVLKENGLVPVAKLAAFRDPAAARANRGMAIGYTGQEYLWLDNKASAGGNPWLNPYSDEAVQFIGDLIGEVQSMGFDNVLLENVQFPLAQNGKQDFGSTGGRDRSAQLAADIALWDARFSGSVTLWYGYSLAQVTDGAATEGAKAAALGVKNLVVEVPAKQTMEEAARNALSDALAASGVEHTVFWDDAAGLFR